MQSVKLKLGGKSYNLKVMWPASVVIAQEVADPIYIFEEIGKAGAFAEQGFNYDPRVRVGLLEANRIVRAVLNDNGHELSEEDIGEMMVAGDTVAVQAAALEILAAIVTPTTAPKPGKGAARKKAKPRTG